jgi:hypothetical protein
MKLHLGLKTWPVDVSGVSPEFGRMRNLIPQEGGRFIDPTEGRTAARPLPRRQARRESAGGTLIVITHDMSLARRAGRVVEVHDGRILKDSASEAA